MKSYPAVQNAASQFLSRNTVRLVAFVLAVSGTALTAEAATILYTDRAAFEAAGGQAMLLTFNDPTVCAGLQGLPPNFCRADYGAMIVGYDSVLSAGQIAPPSIVFGGTNQVNTLLAQPVTSIGFDVIPTSGTVNFNLFLGSAAFFSAGGYFSMSTPSFLGFISTDGMPYSELLIDNFHCTSFLGSSSPCAFSVDNVGLKVPEPGTLLLSTSLLPFVALLARRRKRATSV